jgi:hypothetical protein
MLLNSDRSNLKHCNCWVSMVIDRVTNIDRSQNHHTKDRFRKAEATPTNQPQSTKPKLIDRSFQQCIKILLNRDRASNTKIVGFLEVGNRSIIPTRYKDAPQ